MARTAQREKPSLLEVKTDPVVLGVIPSAIISALRWSSREEGD